MQNLFFILVISIAFLVSCAQPEAVKIKVQPRPEWVKPATVSYSIAKAKEWLRLNAADSNKLKIVLAVNRTDAAGFAQMDSVIIPGDLSGDIVYYLPFPVTVNYLKDINKIIFFSYPTQTFAAYENGVLVYTGPTNMGRKKDPTPVGLFYANWKAEKTISTVNDEWELLWNFNIANKEGVGWHQYSLPGYPASHSCLRLQEKDARYLYTWADQWVLDKNDSILLNGTPVIVFGIYPFDAPKPWFQLASNAHALDIPETEIEKQTAVYLNTILAEQKKRETSPGGNQQ